ncbi:MAG: uncharacterized protein JWR45_3357 [Blastococcus sp.]|jgi:hypothetical protein|nr:uncharacterized protein [Blastococcus sp.]
MTDPSDPDAIKAEIEATREQLSRTVDELSARLDVPARAKESAARAKDTAVETYRESPPLVIAGGVALAGAVVGLVILRRKRAITHRPTTRRMRTSRGTRRNR